MHPKHTYNVENITASRPWCRSQPGRAGLQDKSGPGIAPRSARCLRASAWLRRRGFSPPLRAPASLSRQGASDAAWTTRHVSACSEPRSVDGSKSAGRIDTPAPDRLAIFACQRRSDRYGGPVSPDAGQKSQTPTSGGLSLILRKAFWAACLMPDGESLEWGVAESAALAGSWLPITGAAGSSLGWTRRARMR